MKRKNENKKNKQFSVLFIKSSKGNTLLLILVFMGIFLVMIGGLLSLTIQERKLNLAQTADAQAMQIAEAGLNYYRWHLAHDQEEYELDTGEHEYTDMNGIAIGKYNIEVTPPDPGSTVVTIRSTGWLDDYPHRERVVEAKYGKQSLAHYAFLTNTNVWFGSTENLNGEMHSNGGIRMDGTTNARMTSAKETYNCTVEHDCCTCSPADCWDEDYCPGHSCCEQVKDGTWGSGGPTDFWDFPVPTIDFDILTTNLSTIRTTARDEGFYIRKSNRKGYQVIFNPNSTFDIYRIDEVKDNREQSEDGSTLFWAEQKIKNRTFISTNNMPASGIMFIEDNVWVEGTVNGKVTLVSARLPDKPSTNTTIYINDNINYSARDGNHTLGLIAQKDILVPRHAPSDLTIDAIMLAQKGHVMRHYYADQLVQDSIEVYGGIITNQIWTWSWVYCDTCPVIDGYTNTLSIYDPNLTFNPPPSFPTTGEYTFISWEEIQ